MATREQIENWLLENKISKYKLLEAEIDYSQKSKFIDLVRNVEFYCQFSIFKRNLKRNPDALFGASREELNKNLSKVYNNRTKENLEEIKQKRKQTNIEKYGVENVMMINDIKNNQQRSVEISYGVKSPLQNKEIKQKQEKTMMEKYGTPFSLQNKQLKQKQEDTLMNNYGVLTPLKSPVLLEKQKQTNIQKYGVDNPQKNIIIKKATQQTNLERYGFENSIQNEEVKEKIKQTKIQNGHIKIFEKKSSQEWAFEKGFSNSHFNKLIREIGFEEAVSLLPQHSSLESLMEKILLEINPNIKFIFNKQLKNTKYKPDFLIEDRQLIIECDGLYWHSDKYLKQNYHFEKKKIYKENNYFSLFFRENEILNQTHIVRSIIQNKLGSNEKIGARECEIEQIDNDISKLFFEQNHLMREGSGRTYALTTKDGIMCAMRVRFQDKATNTLEISRFCTKNGVSVMGGQSRLIKHIIETEKPSFLISFIDKRYGEGKSLVDLGFELMNCDVSFLWTNGTDNYHRMKFPGNSGYSQGFNKIWDCGQAKYVLKLI